MKKFVLAAGVVGAALSAASGDVLLTFGFTDLSGNFTRGVVPGEGSFRAEAADTANLQTSGDVSRLTPAAGTADFDAGFVSSSAFADVVIDISVFANNGTVATGLGAFTVTDDDGDTLSGDISGTWVRAGNITYFNGVLANVVLTDNGTLDGLFDGTDGGSFDLDLDGDGPYDGAFVQLFIVDSGFFTRSFRGVSVQVDGEIVPGSAGLALLGVAGLAGIRRRR